MVRDLRVFFVGDSFVAGVGDPEDRGWVGRLAARTHREDLPLTGYNLGVRRDTSDDVCRRWATEVAARRAEGCEERLVLSFGVNDTTVEGGVPRVDPARSVANLLAVAEGAAATGLPLLVVGPPPVDDPAQIERIAGLDERFAATCAAAGVPYVRVVAALLAEPRWMREVRVGDGAHPAATGYTLLSDLVLPAWRRWIGTGP
ncbi:GDSL-type esterase/lipase family protein [Pseudonocardia nigra]|uniref:GDSL-type esterase/lipase family protein n=1 Tax=Pseudonocardia nigra TaxID=1921578 RepID=UPI001C604C48|nr:GDSL-type esterase/lipase family protein [Pseudonocardia nigra]